MPHRWPNVGRRGAVYQPLSRGVNRNAIELAATSSKTGYAMQKTATMILNLWNDESGISSVEYALLLAFVAAGIITAAELLSNAVQNEMEDSACLIETGSVC